MARNQEMIRQWEILRTLDAQRLGSHIKDLAREFGVTDRTIRRDLYALQEAGFPVEEVTRENNKKYWLLSSKLVQRIGDLGLSLPELGALYFGRKVLHNLVGPPFRDDIQSALGKISRLLPQRVRDGLDRTQSAIVVKGDPEGLPTGREYQTKVQHLVNAVLGNRRVELLYYSMASEREKSYVVEPLRLVFGDGALYLRAYVADYRDVRTFAVTRMRKVTPREDTFTPRAESEDPFHNSIGIHSGPPIDVELEFSPRAGQYVIERRWHPTQETETQPNGRVRMRLRVSDDFALRSWIMGFGRNVRVVSPVSLAEWVQEELEQMRTAYANMAPADADQAPLPFDSVAPLMLGFADDAAVKTSTTPSNANRLARRT